MLWVALSKTRWNLTHLPLSPTLDQQKQRELSYLNTHSALPLYKCKHLPFFVSEQRGLHSSGNPADDILVWIARLCGVTMREGEKTPCFHHFSGTLNQPCLGLIWVLALAVFCINIPSRPRNTLIQKRVQASGSGCFHWNNSHQTVMGLGVGLWLSERQQSGADHVLAVAEPIYYPQSCLQINSTDSYVWPEIHWTDHWLQDTEESNILVLLLLAGCW